MKANDYQERAARTLIDKPRFQLTSEEQKIIIDAISLNMLAGAVAEQVKKGILHRHGFNATEYRNHLVGIGDLVVNLLEGHEGGEYHLNDEQVMILWNLIGVQGEAGEMASEVLFAIAEDREPDLIKEIGDTLWYLAALCTKMHYQLSLVMRLNIEKLLKRYSLDKGFNEEESRSRVDVDG